MNWLRTSLPPSVPVVTGSNPMNSSWIGWRRTASPMQTRSCPRRCSCTAAHWTVEATSRGGLGSAVPGVSEHAERVEEVLTPDRHCHARSGPATLAERGPLGARGRQLLGPLVHLEPGDRRQGWIRGLEPARQAVALLVIGCGLTSPVSMSAASLSLMRYAVRSPELCSHGWPAGVQGR
jgi:hypothetical protein